MCGIRFQLGYDEREPLLFFLRKRPPPPLYLYERISELRDLPSYPIIKNTYIYFYLPSQALASWNHVMMFYAVADLVTMFRVC